MQRRVTAGLALILAILVFPTGSFLTAIQRSRSIAPSDAAALEATEDILKSVSRLRGLDVRRPVKSGLKSRDEIEQSVIRDLDESTTPQEFDATQKAYAKLGLISRDFQLRNYTIKLLREQVAGFYEPKTQEFYLAAWLPFGEQKTVIAHELCHALQDQHFNLRRFEKWPKGDSDAELAAHALVEGEATIVMYQYAFEQEGMHLDVTKIASITERLLQESGDSDSGKYPVMANAPAVLRNSLQFPYVFGAGFVQELLRSGSWQALNGSYKDLPSSTEQIMHPAKFLTRDAPAKVELLSFLSVLGKDWKHIDTDVNGEFGYQLLLAEFIGKASARKAAEGWGGDRYSLYEDERTGALLIVQYTTWDSAADAKEFFNSYCERTEKRYKSPSKIDQTPNNALYQTSEGLVSIEIRDKRVAIIEGAASRPQLDKMTDLIWQSKASVQ